MRERSLVRLAGIVGAAAGALALGPALGPGFLLHVDMVGLPGPPWNPDLLGLGAALPRAVPSDLVVYLLSWVLPDAWVIKALVLVAFALGCAGMAALVPVTAPLPRLAAGVLFVWNPWTYERLDLGQWAILLGYAGLPVVAIAARRVAERGVAELPRLGLALLPGVVGGVSCWVLTAVLLVAQFAASRARAANWLVGLGALLLASTPWLLPALLRTTDIRADPAGFDAFALRPDGPFGPFGTALQLAGVWASGAVPAGRELLLVQVLALTLGCFALAGYRFARDVPTAHWAGLLGAGAVGMVGACLPTLDAGAALLRAVAEVVPAVAVLRDSSRWLGLVAVAVCYGFALVVAAVGRAAGPAAALVGVVAVAAPLALLPAMAWGLSGALRPATYPESFELARAAVRGPDAVLVLPWKSMRGYPWNPGGPSIAPASKMFAAPTVANDEVRVGDVVIAGESPLTPRVGRVLAEPGPLSPPLRALGIGWVLVELDGTAETAALVDRLAGATLVVDRADLRLYRLDGPVGPVPDAVRANALVVVWTAVNGVAIGAVLCALLAGKLRASATRNQ
ncbi:hypothetical protein [Actinokineospora sp.]|uniref:hypothetical protein n=1 Tax=Actinokineospora sp. TaxID=1872133 RepID=UPI00403844FD